MQSLHVTRMRNRIVASLFLLAAASPAAAQWVRHHPSHCQPEAFAALANYAITNMGRGSTLGDQFPVTVICPAHTNNSTLTAAITEVNVYVTDSHKEEGFSVRACRSAFGDELRVCSEHVYTDDRFTGDAVLTLTARHLEVWTDNSFNYLEVRIPRNSGQWSYFNGWTATY